MVGVILALVGGVVCGAGFMYWFMEGRVRAMESLVMAKPEDREEVREPIRQALEYIGKFPHRVHYYRDNLTILDENIEEAVCVIEMRPDMIFRIPGPEVNLDKLVLQLNPHECAAVGCAMQDRANKLKLMVVNQEPNDG